jgi:hypothetical protein
VVELAGALSNQATRDKLAKLNACRKRLLKEGRVDVKVTERPPARAGDIVKAIVAVLAESGGHMRACEVHLAVEHRLRRPVSRKSVKACLSEWTLSATPLFRRVSYGRYSLLSNDG